MNKYLFLFFLPVFLFSKSILFEWDGEVLYDCDFYQAVPFSEWSSLDSIRKESVLDDFLYKELVFYHAQKMGLDHFPKTHLKLRERKKHLLTNNYYEHSVALPHVDKKYLDLTKKHLTEKVFVHHVLFGFNGCALKNNFKRTKEEALALANQIKSTFVDSSVYMSLDEKLLYFSNLASQQSEDPSVVNNKGSVGWISWGQVMPSFQKTAFTSPVFTISNPVLTDYGYHLVFIEKRGFSDYYYYDPDYLEGFSFKFAVQNTPIEVLRSAATAHDSLILHDDFFIINEPFVNSVVDFILTKKREENLRGGKSQYLVWLEEFVEKDLLFVFNGKGFGVGWVINKIKNSPASRVPRITSYGDFVSLISSFVLHGEVLKKAKEKNVFDIVYYNREFFEHSKNILYKEYEKHVTNNIEVDSSSVVDKYNLDIGFGKHQKPLEVVYSEIRVDKKSLIDSVYAKYKKGVDFSVLVSLFNGNIKSPIKEGRGGFLGEAAFSLPVGGVSSPIENLNKTFSIIRVEKFIEASTEPLLNVYSSIESRLIENKKDSIKNNLGVDLVKFYNVKKQGDFLFY